MALTEFLTQIANAIRTKKGTTAKIKATDFASEIASIDNSKFSELVSRGITEVDVLDLKDITKIGNYAFYNCTGLTSITIPDNITSISGNAFSNCNGLESVVVGNGVASIYSSAFSGCSKLISVDFSTHTSVPTLTSTNVFSGTHEDLQIKVPTILYEEWISATNWSAYADNIVVDQPLKFTLYGNTYAVSSADGYTRHTSIVIPNTYKGLPVTIIDDTAFLDCSNLTYVVIGENITSIWSSAFEDCSSLTNIEIPSSVTSIEDYAFMGCTKLKRIDFSSHTKVPSLGSDVFFGTASNLQIKVPTNYVELGWEEATNWSDYANRLVTSFTN